jgi:hypothetical protein
MQEPPTPPGGSPPPPPPSYPAPAYQTGPPAGNAPGAVPALILGILSVTVCAICAPFAIWQGRKAEELAKTQGYTGEGMAKAGWILGIIGTVFLALGLLYVVLVVAVGISSA